jgi:hypothetical protein
MAFLRDADNWERDYSPQVDMAHVRKRESAALALTGAAQPAKASGKSKGTSRR